MKEKQSRHLEELDYFNGICCLLVMLLHTLSFGITGLDKGSWQLALIYFPWKISGFVVPAFLFTGALKMSVQFDSTTELSYPAYIWRRIRKIYLPYVIYVVVYFAVFARLALVEVSGTSFVTALITGNISAQFYYVIIVMQFYLLMPLWRWVVKHIPWYIALPVAMMISLAMLKGDAVLAYAGVTFEYCDRVCLTYLFFWVMGLYAGQNYSLVQRALSRNKRAVFLSGLAVLFFVFVTYVQYVTDIYLYDTGFIKPFSDILTIFIILCFCLLLKDSHALRLRKALNWLHRASYSVFLSYCLFLTLATYYLWQFGIVDVGVHLAVRAAVCYTLPFILYWLIERVKLLVKAR